MLSLEKLDEEREVATQDKVDLFDFYHKNWPLLTKTIQGIQLFVDKYREYEEKDEEFCPNDAYGGNMDDAYNGGFDQGKMYVAQVIKDIIKEA